MNDEFTKLFRHMEDQFATVNKKLDARASQSSVDSLTNSIDHFIKRFDDHDANMSARDVQFERLHEWSRKVSAKTGIPLEKL